MAEGEMHASVEKTSPVVERVRQAIERVWKKPQLSEYQQIRKQLDARLDWHGGGVYRHYVENMDKVSKYMFGDKKAPLLLSKLFNRFSGAWLGVNTAAADIAWNVLSYPFRRILPIPKDVFKRLALVGTYAVRGALTAGEANRKLNEGVVKVVFGTYKAAHEAPSTIQKFNRQVVKTMIAPQLAAAEFSMKHHKQIEKVVNSAPWQATNKAIKSTAEAVITAPEVAVKMVKNRVDAITNKIKHPFAKGVA